MLKLMTITPEQARIWQKATIRKRTLSVTEVEQITNDILTGCWEGENGETIKIGTDGSIIDGNHRIAAIIKANKPVQAYVLFDAKPSMKIDIGMKRNLRQNFYMGGFIEKQSALYRNSIAGMIRLAAALETESDLSVHTLMLKKIKPEDILSYYERERTFVEAINKIAKQKNTHKKRGGGFDNGIILYSMFAALKCGIKEGILSEWFRILSTGFYDEVVFRNVDAAKSVVLYRDFVTTHPISRHHDSNTIVQNIKKTMSSINNYNKNLAVNSLRGSWCFKMPHVCHTNDDDS